MAGKVKNGVKGERIKRNPSPQPKYLNGNSPPRHESSDSQDVTKKAVGTVKNETQDMLHSYSFGTLLFDKNQLKLTMHDRNSDARWQSRERKHCTAQSRQRDRRETDSTYLKRQPQLCRMRTTIGILRNKLRHRL